MTEPLLSQWCRHCLRWEPGRWSPCRCQQYRLRCPASLLLSPPLPQTTSGSGLL